MSFLPVLKAGELIKALTRAGFKIIRQSGSHVRLQHALDSRRQTTVPHHSADIPHWLLREILRQAGISAKQLLKLLDK